MKFKNLVLVGSSIIVSMALISCGRTSVDENIEDAAERTDAAVKDLGDAAGDVIDDAADKLD